MHSNPKAAGLDPARLARMDAFLKERYLDTDKLPGTLALIHRRGEVGHFSVQGYADKERGTPLSEDTLFRIYSMTKPITSVALMMLVEEGRIALDDPVHRYIPEWRDLRVYDGGVLGTFRTKRPERPMLVVDLMRHTSGLTYGFQERSNVDAAYRHHKIGVLERHGTLEEMIANLAELPLEFSPGTKWNYSVSTDVVGWLVQVVSGMPFEEFLRTRIFEPLEMHDTFFHVPEDKHSRFAACYAYFQGTTFLYDDPVKSPYLQPQTLISGGGGLVSTAADYLTFCRMLLAGGRWNGTQFLSPKTIDLMTRNHLPGGKELPDLSISLFSEAGYAGVGFGLGFSVMLDPAKALLPGSPGEYSWGGAASTYFWIDPKEELIAIFMTQLMPSTLYPVRREMRTLTYSAIVD